MSFLLLICYFYLPLTRPDFFLEGKTPHNHLFKPLVQPPAICIYQDHRTYKIKPFSCYWQQMPSLFLCTPPCCFCKDLEATVGLDSRCSVHPLVTFALPAKSVSLLCAASSPLPH